MNAGIDFDTETVVNSEWEAQHADPWHFRNFAISWEWRRPPRGCGRSWPRWRLIQGLSPTSPRRGPQQENDGNLINELAHAPLLASRLHMLPGRLSRPSSSDLRFPRLAPGCRGSNPNCVLRGRNQAECRPIWMDSKHAVRAYGMNSWPSEKHHEWPNVSEGACDACARVKLHGFSGRRRNGWERWWSQPRSPPATGKIDPVM